MLSNLLKKSTAIFLCAVLLLGLAASCMAAESVYETGTDTEDDTAMYAASAITNAPDIADVGEVLSYHPLYEAPRLIGADGVHTGYVKGYDDGRFYPDEKLTRAQAAMMLYRLILSPGEERAAFQDVPEDAWFYDAIGYLAAIDVLDSSKEKIAPEEIITRSEFIAMVTYLMAGHTFEKYDIPFPDVPADHEYADEIAFAASRGWIRGGDAGFFFPDNGVSRAETVTIINRVIGAVPDKEYMKNLFFSPFSDVFATHWAYYDIMEAAVEHAHDADSPAGAWITADLSGAERPEGLYFNGLDYYCVDPTGAVVRDGWSGGLYFGADGRYTSGDATVDGYVKSVLAGIVTPGMTDMDKLRAAYLYTRDSFTYLRRNYYEVGDTSWAVKEATTMFTTKRGNCYCFSAVFYFLARQLGFDAVLISGKVNNHNPVPHAWVEIAEDGEMIMYDAELEMAERKKGHYNYDFFHMAYDETPWRYWR